jgi:GTP pyrophosphokinase
VYVVTPQGKVIDLPAGSTPIDFAYALHSDLGHRCRGAKVDGHMVPLDTVLKSGQRVEVVAAKTGSPSRDWLNAERGFVRSHRARQKIRQWFNAQALSETVAAGRAAVEKELKREGQARANLDALASKLGFGKPDELFAAVARDEVNLRQLQVALRELSGAPAEAPPEPSVISKKAKSTGGDSGILVVGMDRLLTQLARCCKPVPPDPIRGFVTRGKGVSIHREDCPSLKRIAERQPERLIEADWGAKPGGGYAVEMAVTASDRPGLLRDIASTSRRCERRAATTLRSCGSPSKSATWRSCGARWGWSRGFQA